jgi:heme A synthase
LLLFWAVLKPVERKGVLLLTVAPVMIGLVIAGILAVTTGLVPGTNMVPVWVLNGIIIIIFSLAYYFASQLAGKPG